MYIYELYTSIQSISCKHIQILHHPILRQSDLYANPRVQIMCARVSVCIRVRARQLVQACAFSIWLDKFAFANQILLRSRA